MSANRTHFLIPIHVDALVVAAKGNRFEFSKAAPQYARLKDEYYIGADLRFPWERPEREPGVHLHFRLPAALSHLRAGDRQFPRIPNRWLVWRSYDSGGLRTKAWLVRGDEKASGDGAIVLPIFPADETTPLELRAIGVAEVIQDENGGPGAGYDCDGDNKPAKVELTAITGGDAGFSAHYPACRNILGLHDDMKGVPVGANISYMVAGWYSGIDDDPWSNFRKSLNDPAAQLSEADKKKQIDEWMDEYRCHKDFPDAGSLPEGILCHGRVRNVSWPQDPATLSDRFRDFDKPEEYWVDAGNSSAEAFAARVARWRGTPDAASRDLLEDLVNAFQTGLLSQGTDFSNIDAELHRQTFAPAAGPRVWNVRPEAKKTDSAEADEAGRAPGFLPEELQEKLDNLNRREREYDRVLRRLRDYQWELYALWHRYTAAQKSGDAEADVLKKSQDAFKSFVTTTWRQEVKKAETLRDGARDSLTKAVQQYNGVEGAITKYVLPLENPQPSEPFYAPKDPILLLSGPPMQAISTVSRPKGAVRCRVSGEELKSFSYDETNGKQGNSVKAEGVKYLDSIPPWCRPLLDEAALQDKMRAIAQDSRFKNLKTEGAEPDPYGVFEWESNPWIPLYVYWKTDWQDESADNVVRDRWTLDSKPASGFYRNTDLVPSGQPPVLPASAKAKKEVSGLSFPGLPLIGFLQGEKLSGSAKTLFGVIEEKFRTRLPRMMSLTLEGFHDALIMRRAGDQLPPLDYDKWYEQQGNYYLDKIGQAFTADFRPDSSPDTTDRRNPFCPLRVGNLQVTGLTVIDAFGQTFDLPLGKVEAAGFTQSGRMAPALAPSAARPPLLSLPPRFCRPVRLEFTGVTTTPTAVCGWVVRNHLDQNVVLYASNGRPEGILQKRFKSTTTTSLYYWVPIPGSAVTDAKENGVGDEYLKDFAKFVLGLDASQGEAFDTLLDQAVVSTGQRQPEDNPAVSVLVGRPLALVRAELGFELDGLPAFDQEKSWKTLQDGPTAAGRILSASNPPWNEKDVAETGNVQSVSVPVRLGDDRSAGDGLIGFFKGAPASSPRPFYSTWGMGFSGSFNPGKLDSKQDLELSLLSRTEVTLLMDPQARVHATSGVLPRAFLQLPAAELAAARQVREVFFQTAPVLGTGEMPQIPRPSDDYGEWSWAYRTNVTGWNEDPTLASASDRAGSAPGWPTLTEGWLKLRIDPVRINSLWMERPAGKPKKNTTVTIAWSAQGADFLELWRVSADGKDESVGKWKAPLPAPGRWLEILNRDTTFELRAWDKSGHEISKQITIQVED
jgi:hypothetical protein